MEYMNIIADLPVWFNDFAKYNEDKIFSTLEKKMDITIEAAGLNVENNTGGPFGAAVFEKLTGRLISIGVNFVVREKKSILHAEVVAIIRAQNKIREFDLSSFELFSSVEPCAMCQGAIYWAGIKKIVYASGEKAAIDIGFDEGIKPMDWQEKYKTKGIEVISGIKETESNEVLKKYKEKNGVIY